MITNYRTTLIYNGASLTLMEEEEPINLADISFKMKRHPEFHGVFPEISTSLKFFGSGYDFLKNAYNQTGIEGIVRCVIDAFDLNWEPVYDGRIDFSDAKLTERFIEVDIKANNCLDDFLNRIDVPMNLYNEPCFTELTMDQTAILARYKYAPYLLKIPEVAMQGFSNFELGSTDTFSRTFMFKGGFGCTLFLCDGLGPPPCGYSSACDNFSPLYIYQIIPANWIADDLLIGNTITPDATAVQEVRDCGYNDIFDETAISGPVRNYARFDPAEAIATAQSCLCHEYEINVDIFGEYKIYLTIYALAGDSPVVEYVRVTPEVIIKWGAYEQVLATLPTQVFDFSCTPLTAIGASQAFDLGDYAIAATDALTIPCGIVIDTAPMAFYIRFNVGGIYENTAGVDNGFITVDLNSTFSKFSGEIKSTRCMTPPPVGETETYAYLMHEAFSRLVEYYTNNCLRVKTRFFGRPNSLEWGDAWAAQNPQDGYNCYPSTGNCAYPGAPSPFCSPTFDLSAYQPLNYGCGSATAITYGINLRQRGTECFISFKQLFDSANAVWGIGMGWTEGDRDNIFVENWEYFYSDEIILDLTGADLYNSKLKTKVATDYYINRYSFGYENWLDDEYNTKDVIHATREYSVLVKNIKNTLEKKCEFIADGYAIEFQRRLQVFSDNNKFDDKYFFVCVGKSDNPLNTITYNNPGPITRPSHLFIAEQGVANSVGIADDVLNYRISPANIIDRHAEWLSIGLWPRTRNVPNFGFVNFAKGKVNFNGFGSVLPNHVNCINPGRGPSESGAVQAFCSRIFPEITEIEYPLTTMQYRMLRFNPYGTIKINEDYYFLLEIDFSPAKNSKIKLLKRRLCDTGL